MKKKILLTFYVILLGTTFAFAESSDFNMEDIDFPTTGRGAVTQEQFDAAIEQKTKSRETIFTKFNKWLNRNNQSQQPADDKFKKRESGELGTSLKEYVNRKPNIIIPSTIEDYKGIKIQSGHYQLDLTHESGKTYINFYQGSKFCGSIIAKKSNYNNDDDGFDIIFAKLTHPYDGIFRIIFSNMNGCYEGFARVEGAI